VGLRGNFGTHSLRKTWGYHACMLGVDLALIMHKLNHESIAYTKRYLGTADEELQPGLFEDVPAGSRRYEDCG
jgi:site-specific recombinase XerD